jgi:uncharacterized SAM-binding protein YcdF (DUF218 family)
MKYNAIVCLGGNVEMSGEPGLHARLRTDKAISLYKKNVAPVIIFCGKHSTFRKANSRSKTEAQAMADYAFVQGVPRSAMILEEESKRTVENAKYLFENIIEPKNWKNILIITSRFHIFRTQLIFRKIIGDKASLDFIFPENAHAKVTHLIKELCLIFITRLALLGVQDGDKDKVVQRLGFIK